MIALRVVLDTNIVVSAALKPDGLRRTVVVLALTKPARWYVTESILDEYREVLARPELKIRKGARAQLMRLIDHRTHLVRPARPLRVTPDPDDNLFLECADAARADYLVTGNQRHFPAFWKRTKVITSRELIAIVAPHLTQRVGGAGGSGLWRTATVSIGVLPSPCTHVSGYANHNRRFLTLKPSIRALGIAQQAPCTPLRAKRARRRAQSGHTITCHGPREERACPFGASVPGTRIASRPSGVGGAAGAIEGPT